MSTIDLVHLLGHTPGHSGYRIRSGGETLLIWGDIVHQPRVQFPHCDIGVAFDVNPRQAAATRRRVMQQAAARFEAIAGIHTEFPSFGRVATEGTEGYRFVPLSVDPGPAAAE